ncbi:MAG: hypothetical protein R2737_02060 [Candidatus Nanopelagicales bacterium]
MPTDYARARSRVGNLHKYRPHDTAALSAAYSELRLARATHKVREALAGLEPGEVRLVIDAATAEVAR